MPKVIFMPGNTSVDVAPSTKILVAANQGKVPIRFGCGACRCGTCAIEVIGPANLSLMEAKEKELLHRMGLDTGGTIRLSCQARIVDGTVTVDLAFQEKYSPDAIESEGK